MDLSCGECDAISLYLYVALLIDQFVLCVCECLVKRFAISLGVVVILLLNVMCVLFL